MFLSIVYAALSLFFLALCSEAAGLSNNASYQSNRNSNQTYKNAWNALSSGYGFGAFFFFAAFAVSLSAAFHISPLVAGSNHEVSTLKNPIEIARK